MKNNIMWHLYTYLYIFHNESRSVVPFSTGESLHEEDHAERPLILEKTLLLNRPNKSCKCAHRSVRAGIWKSQTLEHLKTHFSWTFPTGLLIEREHAHCPPISHLGIPFMTSLLIIFSTSCDCCSSESSGLSGKGERNGEGKVKPISSYRGSWLLATCVRLFTHLCILSIKVLCVHSLATNGMFSDKKDILWRSSPMWSEFSSHRHDKLKMNVILPKTDGSTVTQSNNPLVTFVGFLGRPAPS